MPLPVAAPHLRVAVIGPGGIGSAFAFHLSRAGHDVTVVGRGARLQRLRQDQAIVTTAGERASVGVADRLDLTTVWDLVLVTVLASEVEVLLPTLGACDARAVMFMFNTFQSLDRLRAAAGEGRTAFGFPAIGASIRDGKLSSTVLGRGASTTVSDSRWATVFSNAGIPSTTHPDMQGWLRTHAALVVPLELAALRAHRDGRGATKREAIGLARAMREGLDLVRRLGDRITPGPVAILRCLPVRSLGALIWVITRLPIFVRAASIAPEDEPAMLIDEMSSAAPEGTPALLCVRPG